MFGRIIKPRLFPASVRNVEGTKWGYIDEKGKFVLKPTFEDAGEFQQNGLAIVRKGGAGVITQTGKFVVRPIYSSIFPLTEGRAIAMLNEGGSVVLNEKGKVLTQKAYSFISPYQGGRAVFQDSINGGTTLYGYLDLNGNVAIPAQYQYAFDMSEGKALVQVKDKSYALLNSTGTQLQTYPYEQMNGLSEGLISFKRTYQDKAGYVDEAGNVVIKPQFGMALPFQGGRAIVNASIDYKNKYGLIDKTGNYLIPPRYNDINQLGGNRAAIGRAINPEQPFVGSTYAIADTLSGQIMTDFQYDAVNNYKGEYSSVTQGLKSFFINKSGRQAKDLPVIDGIGTLSIEGQLVKAFVDQRLSYYDKAGNLVYAQNSVIPVNRNVSIREEKYRPNKDYLVYYPQLQGMKNKEAEKKVNEVLRTQSQVIPVPPDTQLDYNYTGDFSVQFYKKNLLILELNGYNYPFGAAHGMPTQIMVPVDISTGKIYELKDLFKPNSDYVKVLSDLVAKQIQENPDNYFPDSFKGIQPDQPFYVSSYSLFLYFTPYEIAPYAAGFPTFEIPFKEINNIIDKKGDFWRSFH